MNISLRAVAEAVLARRASLSSVIFTGDFQAEIGSDGLREALQRRWILADHESGFLKVTNHLTAIHEMENVAADPRPQIGDTVIVTAEGKAYQGVVRLSANGKYKISFGAEKPGGNPDADYGDNEVKLMGRPDKDGRTQPVQAPPPGARGPVSSSPVVP